MPAPSVWLAGEGGDDCTTSANSAPSNHAASCREKTPRLKTGLQQPCANFAVCGKNQIFVIPRRAARRGISLIFRSNQSEIPHFVRNDKIINFFPQLVQPRRACAKSANTSSASGSDW